ncbi:MAG: methoxymalonyl-ACP biosynthesis protein FkbH, partial [Aldersonia sp.]|nr:methoxymalonyl-ACP biosynthesis protein FkbH [Aldersonia sp.]
ESDFVRVVANWRPKPDNLTELAEALNLGLDGFVFVDDSAYECGLARHALPDVAVIQVGGEPARHVEALVRDGWFDVREVTAEDRSRIEKYQRELDRKAFLDTFGSLDDYLRELSIEVRLAAADAQQAPRISQLTLRTNQFNLTTRRLQPAQVRDLLAEPAARVLAIHAADRFGDNGVVGAIFTRRDGDLLLIDNFLLSCRVFSRGIEHACLSAVLRQARDSGARAVIGEYRRTAKNGMVHDLYARYGFTPVGDDGAATTFRHDLTAIVAPPEHIQLREDEDAPA